MQAPHSVNGEDMGSLDRIDSLDEYFMLNSPPESPQQPRRTQGTAPFDIYGYYSGCSTSGIAPQGNAKLSTSNISVDRSNAVATSTDGRHHSLSFSSGQSRIMPATQRDIDEILKLDDKDLNLSELFLQSNYRASLNSNYLAMGALKGHDKDLHRTRSHSLSSSFLEETESNPANDTGGRTATMAASTATATATNRQNGIKRSAENGDNMNKRNSNDTNNADDSLMDDFDLGVEPTPLSEIRAKTEQRLRYYEQKQRSSDNNRQTGSSSSTDGLTAQQLQQHTYEQHRHHRLQHSSNYYPFGRSYQLPIPTMPPASPPNKTGNLPGSPLQVPLADAVATAAALASVQEAADDDQTSALPDVPSIANPIVPQTDRTPPQSPALQSSNHSNSWQRQRSTGSRPESRNSKKSNHSSHHHSHSPNLISTQQQAQALPHYQHHASLPHYQHHPAHHASSYPHPLAPPLSVAGSYPAPQIVGPYTTAQQEGNSSSNSGRVRRPNSAPTTVTNGTAAAAVASARSTTPAPAPASTYLPRRGDHMQRQASAAHSVPKGALEDAAKQRRGYAGFHKPATSQTTNNYHNPLPTKYANYPSSGTTGPAGGPPTTIFAKKDSTGSTTAAVTAYASPGVSKSPVPPATMISTVPSVGPYSNGGASPSDMENHLTGDTAYERKKQRAKDARVKLNESIERLHVSMGVAGAESKRRTEQLRALMKEAGRTNESTTDHQAFQLMESCVKTAESAKKWDRPNFVGSAATMIQCLNSQCEILMKELLECQEGRGIALNRPGHPLPAAPEQEIVPADSNESGGEDDSQAKQNEPEQNGEQVLKLQVPDLLNEKRPQETSAGENSEEIPEKRRRLNGFCNDGDEKKEASTATDGGNASPVSPDASVATIMCTAEGSHQVQLEGSVMDLIASFVDPVSLVQCQSVCRSWRGNNGCFAKCDTWMNLCVKRFGFFEVRQWKERENDEDDKDHTRGFQLYRNMDAANVMPPIQLEGNRTFIGAARLSSCGIAAWLFIMERSNGETYRSVKRNPDTESSSSQNSSGIKYTSMPVVECRLVIQNVGGGKARRPLPHTVAIKDQRLTVDASTRRRGEELTEIYWDGRFTKRVLHLDGSDYSMSPETDPRKTGQLAHLELFESVVIVVFIHAKRCSTTAKFLQRSNFMRVIVGANDASHALVIPFKKKKDEENP